MAVILTMKQKTSIALSDRTRDQIDTLYVRTEKDLSAQSRKTFIVLIRWVSDAYWFFVIVGFLTWLLLY